MDKHSLKVLRFLRKCGKPVSRDKIAAEFGDYAIMSLASLERNYLVKQGTRFGGVRTNRETGRAEKISIPNGIFTITPDGNAFLQSRIWTILDEWITRIAAIGGLVLSIIALLQD